VYPCSGRLGSERLAELPRQRGARERLLEQERGALRDAAEQALVGVAGHEHDADPGP